MILTIKGADFSAANIGTLSTVSIRKSIGSGVTHSIPNYVEKGASVEWTLTLLEDYEFGTYSVTMGDETITPTVADGVMTISIASVTAAISISVATTYVGEGEEVLPEEPDTDDVVNAGLTLYQGYVDNKTINNVLATRVKTDFLQGPFAIEVNDGYLIRAAYEYTSNNNTIVTTTGGNMLAQASQQLKSLTYYGTTYAIITFCKDDATQNILPTEDIVKSYSTDVEIEETVDSIEVSGVTIKLGQVLGTSLKEDNVMRAYTVTPINDKTTISTEGSSYVMIPLYDADDNISNGSGTFYTGSDGNFNITQNGSLLYHSTINIADLTALAPNHQIRVMFKRSDAAACNLEDLQNCVTIN